MYIGDGPVLHYFCATFPVCDIWMNLVFHALFVLKVGVCFLIGAKFSELCLWFLVGDKMLVSFLSCMYIEVHDLSSVHVFTKSVCTA